MIEKLRNNNPIVIKNCNIYLFESFGLGINWEPGWRLSITFIFIDINWFYGRDKL